MSDLKLSAVGAACGGGLMVAIGQLQDAASNGLTFTEWSVGILVGIVVGGATGRVGYVAMRWLGRRCFGDEEDE
jgi:hypothetical protein